LVTNDSHPLGRPAQEAVPGLWHFFGAYFHEDFLLDHSTVDGALNAAIVELDREDLEGVRQELVWLLEQPLPESELDRVFFRELHVSYWTYADAMSPRVWLHRVLDRVAQATWPR
jgi:hypothetical protein